MVSRPEIIRTIAKCLRKYKPEIIVVDPVMISKSGYPLLAPEACETLIAQLLPLATLLTPNLPEAEAISGMKVTEKAGMRPVAEKIIALGAKAVLVKGGHLEDVADDLLFDGEKEQWFTGKRIATKNTHGTGCTLSSSLAANLAKGMELAEAVAASKAYVTEAIAHGLEIGSGCDSTHHFVDLYRKAGILE